MQYRDDILNLHGAPFTYEDDDLWIQFLPEEGAEEGAKTGSEFDFSDFDSSSAEEEEEGKSSRPSKKARNHKVTSKIQPSSH